MMSKSCSKAFGHVPTEQLQRKLYWERLYAREASIKWPYANHGDDHERIRLMERELRRRGAGCHSRRWGYYGDR